MLRFVALHSEQMCVLCGRVRALISVIGTAKCTDIESTGPVIYQRGTRGVDLRSWTGSTLQWLGCFSPYIGGTGCEVFEFACVDSSTDILFGINDVSLSWLVAAVIDTGNTRGNAWPTATAAT